MTHPPKSFPCNYPKGTNWTNGENSYTRDSDVCPCNLKCGTISTINLDKTQPKPYPPKPEDPITQHTESGRRTTIQYKNSGGQVYAI